MPALTLTGSREDVIELLEELVDEIRDVDNAEPSIAFMPKDAMAGAFYIEYVPDDDPEGRPLYQIT